MFEEERNLLNEIDDEMKKLFIKRQKVVLKIAEKKFAGGLNIEDRKREEEMLKRLSADIKDEELCKAYILFLKEVISLSKAYQARHIEELKKAE